MTSAGSAVIAFATLLPGGGGDSKIAVVDHFDVAPGLRYARWEETGLIVHVMEFDLATESITLRSVKAKGKETLREMADRMGQEGSEVLGAINGDYFRMKSEAGLPFGAQVSDGRLLFGPMDRSMIAFGPKNEPSIGVAQLKAKVTFAAPSSLTDSMWIKVDDVNELEDEDKRKAGVYLYTPSFLGLDVSRPKGTTAVIETIEPALQIGDICTGKLARVETGDAKVEVPESGCLIYFFGPNHKDTAAKLKAGKPVALKLELTGVPGSVQQAIGGGPRLIRNGKPDPELSKEGFEPVYAMELSKRHPRSAVGFDKERKILRLVTVEGREEKSRGMTFGELAAFLDKLGCWQAMAFDGGGSAGMFVADHGRISKDLGGGKETEERALANALFLVRPKPADDKESK